MKNVLFAAVLLSSFAFAETNEIESVESTEALDAIVIRCDATGADGAFGSWVHPAQHIAANQALLQCQMNSRMPYSCSVVNCFPINVW